MINIISQTICEHHCVTCHNFSLLIGKNNLNNYTFYAKKRKKHLNI